MINKIEINNFRGIKKAQVGEFATVNLLFGKNNCGKSSLLESLFLVSAPANVLLPMRINQFRDIVNVKNKRIIESLFYEQNSDENINIRINFDNNESRDLKINKYFIQDHNFEIDSKKTDLTSELGIEYYGLSLSYHDNEEEESTSTILINSDTEDVKLQGETNKNIIFAKYITSRFEYKTSIEYLKDIIINKKENEILECLRVIEPRIKGINVVNKEVYVDLGAEKLLPINVMGDGIRKLLALLVSIEECKNGILLVDEIDNGFHYSTMNILWKSVIASAKKNNTQIFATTHSLDSIKSLSNIADNKDVKCYKLNHMEDGELKHVKYEIDNIKYLVEQEIEMR